MLSDMEDLDFGSFVEALASSQDINSNQDGQTFALVEDVDLMDGIPPPDEAQLDMLTIHSGFPHDPSNDSVRMDKIRARNRKAQARYRQKNKVFSSNPFSPSVYSLLGPYRRMALESMSTFRGFVSFSFLTSACWLAHACVASLAAIEQEPLIAWSKSPSTSLWYLATWRSCVPLTSLGVAGPGSSAQE
jgi:hypothetical protein